MAIDISKIYNIGLNTLKPKEQKTAKTVTNTVSYNGLVASAPDYNVKVPMQYTKSGVTTLDNGLEIHEYKMANGQKVVIMPSDNTTLQLQTYVNTGSMNEKDDERGISHFMEHMMFNGTRGDNGYKKINSGETFKIVEEMGGYANAYTSYNTTAYEINIPVFNENDFEKAVEIQSAMVNNPAFTDEMIEKEKGPVCSEINMYSDMPDREIIDTSIKNLLNINTTSMDLTGGTVQNVQNINREKLLNYYNTNYCPSNMTTVITGNINPDKAMQIISKHFRSNAVTQAKQLHESFNPIEKTVRIDKFSPKAKATTGALSFVGPKAADIKESVACDAASKLLAGVGNSRIATPLKNLNTAVEVTTQSLSNENDKNYVNSIIYDTTEDNSENALKLIFDKLNNFSAPTEKELANLKLLMKKDFEDAFERSDSSNAVLGTTLADKDSSYLAQYKKIVDSLTSEDISNAVKKYFDTSKASIAIIHPSDVTMEQINDNYKKAQSVSFRGKTGSHKANNVSFGNNISTNQVSRDILDAEKMSEYILQNNIDLGLYDNQRDNGCVKLSITCDAPANVKTGVADILDVMMTRGSAYRNIEQFEEAQNDNCTAISTSCGHSGLSASASFVPEKIGETIELMKENILAPRFTAEDFEYAKKKVKEACLSAQDDSVEYLSKTMFPNQHYGETKDDILANIDNVSLNDVIGLYQYYMQNGKAVASVSAPISKNPDLKNIVFNELSAFPTMKQNKYSLFESYIPVQNSKVFQKETNKSQADISMGYKFKVSDNLKDEVTLGLLKDTLSSSSEIGLFNTLREQEKLAYSVGAIDMYHDNSGVILCNILTTTVDDLTKQPTYENVQKSIDGFHRQINLLKTGQFSDQDFEKIKLKLKANMLRSLETSSAKAGAISKGLASKDGISNVNKVYKIIDEITKQDVVNMANYVFAGNPSYSILANKETLDANSQYLKSLEN